MYYCVENVYSKPDSRKSLHAKRTARNLYKQYMLLLTKYYIAAGCHRNDIKEDNDWSWNSVIYETRKAQLRQRGTRNSCACLMTRCKQNMSSPIPATGIKYL